MRLYLFALLVKQQRDKTVSYNIVRFAFSGSDSRNDGDVRHPPWRLLLLLLLLVLPLMMLLLSVLR